VCDEIGSLVVVLRACPCGLHMRMRESMCVCTCVFAYRCWTKTSRSCFKNYMRVCLSSSWCSTVPGPFFAEAILASSLLISSLTISSAVCEEACIWGTTLVTTRHIIGLTAQYQERNAIKHRPAACICMCACTRHVTRDMALCSCLNTRSAPTSSSLFLCHPRGDAELKHRQ